jgi:predicted methyltransferase
MSSTREKFGLSWLNKKETQAGSTGQGAAIANRSELQIDAALVALGVKVASKLNESPNKTAGIPELIDRSGLPISQVLRILSYLEELQWVRYVDKDKIQLTDLGANQVS